MCGGGGGGWGGVDIQHEICNNSNRDDRHGALQANETLKGYVIRHFVSFDGGENFGFLRLQ